MFTKQVSVVIGLLLVLCGALFGLNVFEGPRIRRVDIDPTQLVGASGQLIQLHMNLPVPKISSKQVHVQPMVPFTATSSGSTIALRFTQKLRYQTAYTITISGLQNLARGAAEARYQFSTPSPSFYYLHRNYQMGTYLTTKNNDAIIWRTLDGRRQKTVFTADRIDDYTVLGKQVVVNTLNSDNTSRLVIASPDSGTQTAIRLPDAGTIDDLAASANGRLFAFSFTSQQVPGAYSNNLFLYSTDTQKLTEITGLDKKPLAVMGWEFAPDGTTLLVQLYDTTLLLVDTTGHHASVPIGQYSGLGNFSFDGLSVAVSNLGWPSMINLQNHTITEIPHHPIAGIMPLELTAYLLNNQPGRLDQIELFAPSGNEFEQYVVFETSDKAHILYQASNSAVTLFELGTSPNDQYVTIETSKANSARYDGYADNAKPENLQTHITDGNTGGSGTSIDGFKIIWSHN